MNTQPIRIKSPADLLALVPCVLGFHPDESLVLVVLSGTGGNLHARIDIAFDDDDELLRAGIGSLMTAVARSGADKVAVIAYTDDEVLAGWAVDLLDEALFELDPRIEIVTAIRADGRRWFALDCDDDCCPPDGRAYDLSTHPITVQSVVDGQVTFRNRDELADSLVGDPDRVEAVADAVEEAVRRLPAGTRGTGEPPRSVGHLAAEAVWLQARVRRAVDGGERLDDAEVARALVAMTNIQVRDVAWSEMSRADARGHVDLWRDVVRRTPTELMPAPAALLGFAAWLSGDGALAWCAVERCLEAQPDYSMAALISQALTAAVPPSTWTPVPPEELPLFAS